MIKVGSIFIPVTNIEQATEWYEKHLGVKKIEGWGEGAGFYFPDSDTQLGLIEVEETQPSEFVVKGDRKNSYFNFLVKDIDTIYHELNSSGVKTTEIEDFNGMKHFDFFDLDMNAFSVVDEPVDSPFHRDNVKMMQQNRK
ncbi:glyoxalase [Virgibacillus indicus]|uniref:Glyoxalase n=1 Tax=Virgibacillus indicus TaxID=2024554 RepID=A0A265N635_9BACI|nr:VOC family protein [Virgibacillus indicus]OZU87470.1 glyoxalase [Virgibacillus indicus]